MTTALERTDALVLTQVVGPEAAQALTKVGLPCPDGEQQAIAHDTGFVACIGQTQYLVATASAPAFETPAPPWCFSRSDGVLRLSGEALFDVLAQFCAADLTGIADGGWLMTRMAGINVWLWRAPADDTDQPASLLIGCDASYERYLYAALDDAVQTFTAQHA